MTKFQIEIQRCITQLAYVSTSSMGNENTHSFKLDQKFIIHFTMYLNIKRNFMF
jgi:hypothetical protein